ncbi:hypothetical protein BHM03_00043491 [Ensete ventricosum]|nr:hypothetical protein BHM03_00043491 [Ensete ventricosum]
MGSTPGACQRDQRLIRSLSEAGRRYQKLAGSLSGACRRRSKLAKMALGSLPEKDRETRRKIVGVAESLPGVGKV